MEQKSKKVKTVYVSNLNYKIDEDDLKGIFGKFGRVDDVMIMMKPGGKLRMGMAFVRMSSHGAALKAIEGLDGKVIDGRTIKVVIAREDQAPRPKHIEGRKDSVRAPKEKSSEKKSRRGKRDSFKDFLKTRK